MARFVTSLSHWYMSLPVLHSSVPVLKAKHAVLSFLVTLLSSQLYYSRKQAARLDYSDFKVSPAIDILYQMPLPAVSQFLTSVLQDVVSGYQWLPSTSDSSLFSQFTQAFWNSTSQSTSDHLRHETGTTAMVLSLLLLSYADALPNPYLKADVSEAAEGVYMKLINSLDDPPALLLLLQLLRDNKRFRDFFATSSEHDHYLPKLCEYVYKAQLTTEPKPKLYLVLCILLVLSEDDACIRFLNKDVKLGNVDWLPEYRTTNMSLGSLLFLTVLRLFRDNISVRNGYLHVLSVALLFNLAPNSVELHEVTAQAVAMTLSALWKRCSKPTSSPEINSAVSRLMETFLDVYGLLLKSTYKHNSWVIYMTLHEAETFQQMTEKHVSPGVIPAISHLIAHFLARLDEDHVLESIAEGVKVYSLPDEMTMGTLIGVRKFELGSDLTTWESWSVPLIWSEARDNGLVRLKLDSVLMHLPSF